MQTPMMRHTAPAGSRASVGMGAPWDDAYTWAQGQWTTAVGPLGLSPELEKYSLWGVLALGGLVVAGMMFGGKRRR